MSDFQLAFFIGLFGSMHCIGMCGPLAFAVPSGHSNRLLVALDKLLYQFGRTISYSFLGLLIGFLGRQLWISGLQQWVSILSGVLILFAAAGRIFKRSLSGSVSLKLLVPFNQLIGFALKHKAGHFIIGILNGLLPCGFVYLAMAGAVNTGGILSSAQYMFMFGLGTVPLMLLATFSMSFAGPAIRRRVNNMMPYMMLCLGIWFVVKGMALDIPFSPVGINASSAECR